MSLWEKVKRTIEDGAKTIKEGAESVAKSVAEKAPGIASTLVEKGKGIADTIGDKAHELVTLGQLKVKHYDLNRDVSNLFAEIGGKVYELIKSNDPNIATNVEILANVEKIKKLEAEIDALEAKMAEVKKAQAKSESTATA